MTRCATEKRERPHRRRDGGASLVPATHGHRAWLFALGVTGLAEPNAPVEVFVDGAKVGDAIADENGDWAFEITTPLGEGDHTIEATTEPGGSSCEVTIGVDARDPAGNSSTDTRTVTIGDGEPGGEFDQFALSGGCTGCSSAPGVPADASLLLLGVGLFGWRRRRRAA